MLPMPRTRIIQVHRRHAEPHPARLLPLPVPWNPPVIPREAYVADGD